ncbi:hypothetical protein R6Q59_019590 [Mikania micrantha]
MPPSIVAHRSSSLQIAINFLRPSFFRILHMNSPVFLVSPEFKFRVRFSSGRFFSDVGLCCCSSRSSYAYDLDLAMANIDHRCSARPLASFSSALQPTGCFVSRENDSQNGPRLTFALIPIVGSGPNHTQINTHKQEAFLIF